MKAGLSLIIVAFVGSAVAESLRSNARKVLLEEAQTVEAKIVGGQQASAGEFPFFVEADGCGGSLIHYDIVLTAAHCRDAFNRFVYVGNHASQSTAGGAERIGTGTRVVHPAFNYGTLENDFMVVKLQNPVQNKDYLQPILLNADASNPATGSTLRVIGYGAKHEDDWFGSNKLRKVDVTALSNEACAQRYADYGGIVDEVMFCAGAPEGGKDSCRGDSGGPIIDSNGYQVGVVSWGVGCGRRRRPGVYARVSGVIDWINEQTCSLSSDPPTWCPVTSGSAGESDITSTATSRGQVTISVSHDRFAYETGWTLVDSSGTVIDEQAWGEITSPFAIVTKTYDLSPGAYTFTITDFWDDGICCDYGEGSYSVSVGGQVVGSGGLFESSDSVSFVVDGARSDEMPAEHLSTPQVDLVLHVYYDDHPAETGWTLVDLSADEELVKYSAGSVQESYGYVEERITVPVGAELMLLLTDSQGDGFVGGIYVDIIVDGVTRPLGSTTGSDFTFEKAVYFAVPSQ